MKTMNLSRVVGQWLMLLATVFVGAASTWAENITLLENNNYTEGNSKHYYVRIPESGTGTLTIAEGGVMSFNVLNGEGEGILELKAPAGYRIHVRGDVGYPFRYGYYYYDTNSETPTQLEYWYLQETSSGNSIKLEQKILNGADQRADRLNLIAYIFKPDTKCRVMVDNPSSGGTIITSQTLEYPGRPVTLSVTPDEGYILSSYELKDAYGNIISLDGFDSFSETYTFNMFPCDITITPTFKKVGECTPYVIMPQNGDKTIEATSDLTSINIYSYPGKDKSYSAPCDANLRIVGPEEKILRFGGTARYEAATTLAIYDGVAEQSDDNLLALGSEYQNLHTPSNEAMVHFEMNKRNGSGYTGLALTVSFLDLDKEFTVSKATGNGVDGLGEFSVNKTTAKYKEEVTVSVTPISSYMIDGVTVSTGTSSGWSYNTTPQLRWYEYAQYGETATATFNMPYGDVIVKPNFKKKPSYGEYNDLYVSFPISGTREVYVPKGVTDFKVYTNRGSSYEYDGNSDGYMLITAPDGYILKIDGTLVTDINSYGRGGDYLSVFDGATTDAPKILDKYRSLEEGVARPIDVYYSSGRQMLLYFHSDDYLQFKGTELNIETVIYPDDHSWYSVNVNSTTGGTVAALRGESSTNWAYPRQTVGLKATPDDGYLLDGITVTDAEGNNVEVTNSLWWSGNDIVSFTMPAADVTVSPHFTNDLTAEGLTPLYLPKEREGSYDAYVPSQVKSFKIYDDGGEDGNYSVPCDGQMVLHVDENHFFELSGSLDASAPYLVGDEQILFTPARLTINMNEYTTDRGGLTTKIGPINGSNEMEINFYAWAGEDSFGGVDLTVTVKDVVNETPFAVWSEADKTLYFGRGDMPVVGNTYTTESGEEVTVTNMWYGEDVTQTPSDAWNAWNSPIAPYCERVVFQPSFATVRPTTLSSWFYQFKALTTLEGMEYLNTSEVTDMSHMFQMCSALTELDLTRFNTEKVTSMTAIFGECSALKTIYCNDTWTCEGWASGNMFYKCNNLVGAISYDINCTGVAYANPDTGYFTRKFLPGDANGDGSVSITDVGLVIDYILGKNPANIVVEAANVNNDSSVSITDVGLIIDIILHQGSHAVKQHGQRMFKTLFPLDYEPQ